jgi:hypothetical protein
VTSIATKTGRTPQTLHNWGKRAEIDSGQRARVPTDMVEKLKALERENRELHQATRSCTRQAPILRWGSWTTVRAVIAFIDDHRAVHGYRAPGKMPS